MKILLFNPCSRFLLLLQTSKESLLYVVTKHGTWQILGPKNTTLRQGYKLTGFYFF